MKRARMLAAVVAALLAVAQAAPAAQTAAGRDEGKPLIQLAILLDTSNSMDGLIAQAKTQLWSIVNEFATAERHGKKPDLHVALYEYGKSSLPGSEGYIRMILQLTTDLDKVSEELFALKTNGGQEYCGWVIKQAAEELAWSKSNDDLKAIFIAGNEPFTQGKVDFRDACKAAISKGIVVNTIHCGPYQTGISGKWKDGADLADGRYMNIDQNRAVVHITAPQDKDIARLNAQLNKTYIAYGAAGKEGAARQVAQDAKARSAAPASLVQRAITKSSGYYRSESWDLVDSVQKGKLKLDEVKEAELPENMRKMTPAERNAYVEAQLKERQHIQSEIQKLSEARKKHVAVEMRKRAKPGEKTLDQAMVEALREQAAKKSFKLK